MSDAGDQPRARRITPGAIARAAPRAYVCLCISTFPAELAALDAAVAKLKMGGVRSMTRSRLIRIALERLDVEAVLAEQLALIPGRP